MASPVKLHDVLIISAFIFNVVLIMPALVDGDMVQELGHFGNELYNKLLQYGPKSNVLMSAFPLATVLVLARLKAGEGAASEIDEALGLPLKNIRYISAAFLRIYADLEKNSNFEMMNSITVSKNQTVIDTFNMNIMQTIDAWSSHDFCKQPSLLDKLDSETEIRLESQVKLKNTFLYAFLAEGKQNFYASEVNILQPEVLSVLAKFNYSEIEDLDAKVLELPYGKGDASLLILLPNSRYGSAKLEKILHTYPLSKILSYLKPHYVKVQLPKFEAVMKISLKTYLKEFGMATMFSRLCDTEAIVKVSEIMLSLTFKIDGSNAGQNALGDDEMPDVSNIVNFNVDHAFTFMVRSSDEYAYYRGNINDLQL